MFSRKEKQASKSETKTVFKIAPVQGIFDLPDVVDKTILDVRYPLMEPYAYAHIYWSEENHELVYDLEEPEMNEGEKKTLDLIEKSVEELINISFIAIKNTDVVIEYLEKNIKVILNEFRVKVSQESLNKMMYYVYRDFVGLNEVEPLMKDYYIEDIECNGVGFPVYLVHRKYRNLRTNITFNDVGRLTSFVEKLAQKCGKYISYATPLLDGALPDGSRVNATYTQDITSRGPSFTVRKFTKEPFSPIKMIQVRTASPELLAYLWILIEYESNILIIGGTGSGKTSFLNSLAFFIPPQARVVSIEDTRELSLVHENWLPSVAREGIGVSNLGGSKHGEVSLFQLLKESFRQRPDYVIVGEIRGQEAYVLFQGMSSGHPSFGTMHAEDVQTMIRRLETKPIELSPSLVESLDAVVIMSQLKTTQKAMRKVKSVVEILKVHQKVGTAEINTPFVWDPRTDKFYFSRNSRIFNKLMTIHGVPRQKLEVEFRRRTELLMKMYSAGIANYKEVQDIITAYYKTPKKVLKKFNIK
ncbi:MAG: type II/IV secretion system ATPase subunit [Candidatus Woesearchaeota archaeon]